jgi:hypothetical protein
MEGREGMFKLGDTYAQEMQDTARELSRLTTRIELTAPTHMIEKAKKLRKAGDGLSVNRDTEKEAAFEEARQDFIQAARREAKAPR